VVVTVALVLVVQTAVDQAIDMVAVREHRSIGVVAGAGRRLAAIRILGGHGDRVLVPMPFVHVVQVAVVQVVDVVGPLDLQVTAAGTVLMLMDAVILAGDQVRTPFSLRGAANPSGCFTTLYQIPLTS